MIKKHTTNPLDSKDFKPIEQMHHLQLELYIDSLGSLVRCPIGYFEEFYVRSLFRLAQLTQQLPYCAHEEKSYLDIALARIYRALAKRRGLLLPMGSSAETVAHQDAIWTFALFSAALCYELGRSLLSVEVNLARQSEGKFIDLNTWSPFTGCFPNTATHYRWKACESSDESLYASLNYQLTTYLLCKDSLLWLAQFPAVERIWLAVISGEAEVKNPLLALIGEGSPVISEKKRDPNLKVVRPSKPAIKTEENHQPKMSPAQLFLTWLNQQVSQERIQCNTVKAPIYQLSEGLFVQSAVLETFLAQHGNHEISTLNDFIEHLKSSACLVPIVGKYLVRFMDLSCLNPVEMHGVLLSRERLPATQALSLYELLSCE